MKTLTAITVFFALLSVPLVVTASGQHEHGSHAQAESADTQTETADAQAETADAGHHGDADHDMQKEHDGMSTDGSMFIVGSMTSKGVKGMAHLKDVSEMMAKMGMKTTHHFMIAFVDEATGEQIENGTVALKITNPDAKVGEAIELIGTQGHFGADITLDMEGEYHFRLGTKLSDGVKRKYHFHHVNK
jgi:hypothetical protein